MNKLFHKLINIKPIFRWAWMRLKKATLPGFEGVPIYNVIQMFRNEIQNDALSVRAAAISFNFILALFPTSIFIFTLIAYIPIEGFDETLLNYIKTIMPAGTYATLDTTIHDIINNRRGGLLSVTFVLGGYFSINGVMNMMRAFDKANPTFMKRNWLQKFVAATKINTLIIFQILVLITLIILSHEQLNALLSTFGWKNKSGTLLYFIRISLTLFTFFNTIALIYYFGPAVEKKYRYFSVGASFATLLILGFSYIFSYYVNFMFPRLNSIYGSLSVMIFIMIWIYANAFVLLFGFELNNSIAVNKHIEEIPEDFKVG
ncbi:MAG: YihY/virulence factor BrkB family protein [Chitinophagales bacterium]